MAWSQGQHVLIIGRTGQGKTYLARPLLSLRRYVVALITKRDAEVWWKWREVATAAAIKLTENGPDKWRLYPKGSSLQLVRSDQRSEFSEMLERVWQEENWTVDVDELYYCQVRLNLTDELVTLWTQGRSKGITCVGGCQRPSRIDRHFISESRYLIAFRIGDGRDRATLAEITGDKAWAESLTKLGQYEFSIFDKDSGLYRVAKADQLANLLTKEWH